MMRLQKTLILLFALSLMMSCNNDQSQVPADLVHNPITADGDGDLSELPSFSFRETMHDFGTVIEGEQVTYSFKFENTGSMDLLISNVSASCGCTATKFTKAPIPSGEDGIITVTLDTRNRKGFQNKSITVAANTQPNKVVLRIKAKVVSPNDL